MLVGRRRRELDAARGDRTTNPDSGIDAATASGQALLVYNHSHSARTPLNMAISDDGRHWSALAVLEDEPGEFSYPPSSRDVTAGCT